MDKVNMICTAISTACFAGIVWIGIHERRRRAKMTPEERKREDEEIERDARIW